MCRRTEEEVVPTVGLPRHRHFAGFFNRARPSTDTGPTFLYGDSDTPPHLVAFYDHAGDTEVHILDLTPRALTGAPVNKLYNITDHLAIESNQSCRKMLQASSCEIALGGRF